MEDSRQLKIEIFAGEGNLIALKKLLEFSYTQLEIDVALSGAIAYSKMNIAEYLMSLGADISNYNYQGVYYAVHNNELEGLKFAIAKGVDINVDNGMLLNESIITARNTKSLEIVTWLLDNGADVNLVSTSVLDVFGSYELRELLDHYR